MKDHWILIAEDDEELREQILIPGFRDSGFANVLGASNAIETYRSMLTRTFALFVLDVGLPDESGLTLARHVRAISDAGIVMLTGRGRRRTDQVKGLDAGADAYLTKPVDIELLVATARSVLRRRHPSAVSAAMPAASFAGWHLDQDGWNLTSPRGAKIRLTQIERVLMKLLFKQAGAVVSREDIIRRLIEGAAVAQDVHDFDPHRLELLVHRLRRKVAMSAADPFPLNTVRRAGYVFTMQ